MSRNSTILVLALVLGVCAGSVYATEEEKPATQGSTTVVAEKTAPAITQEVTVGDATNALTAEETVACGDLSKEPHDFDFNLNDDDDEDDDI